MKFEPDPMSVIRRYTDRPPIDLDAMARDLDLPVEYVNLGSGIAGHIVRDRRNSPKSGFMIRVNSGDHENRKRFTLAHEIAHYVLHRDLIESGVVDDVMYRSGMSGHYETQANQLAADIIMPFDVVKQIYSREHPSDEQLARMFRVSPAAMSIRLERIKRAVDREREVA